jgi:AraC-like DNA-binding protein
MKKLLLFSFAVFVLQIQGQSQNSLLKSSQDNDWISKFKHLSLQQISDTAKYYYTTNNTDTALFFYSLIINNPVKETDLQQMKLVVDAYIKSAIIYRNFCDYRTAYELNIKALILCDKANIESYKPTVYNNVGNIYSYFKKYDLAKLHYHKALSVVQDSVIQFYVLNNLGDLELEHGKLDSACYYLNQSLQICKQHNNIGIDAIQNGLAVLHQKNKQYDSAYYYFQLALEGAKKSNKIERETENLLGLGKFFFEIKKNDSALFYINLSNTVARKNNFFGMLAENYLTLSKIEESKGNIRNAFNHFKTYANLKDSVFNIEVFGDINQLQHLYEISKTNQQVEKLFIEQQINERTIQYQKIIQLITLIVLLLVSGILVFIISQKRKLDTAYKALFEKNIEIITLQENSSKNYAKKYKKSTLTHDMQGELLEKILTLMENTSIICDTKFTVDKLAELVRSNQSYVSQVINDTLKKNFRAFLNGYRIREAQRLFAEPVVTKYTIESVALRVGFKSQSAFYEAFKEITGVSPNFYMKSIQETMQNEPVQP